MACRIAASFEQCQVAAVETGVQVSPLEVVRSLGPRGLYRGFFATLAREAPFGAVVLPLYPMVLHLIGGDAPRTHHQLAGGVFAGGFAAAVTCPLDVVKTRLQLSSTAAASSAAAGTPPASPGALEIVKLTYQADGVGGFFRGLKPRVSIFAGLYGVLFLSYELANDLVK